MNFTIGHEHAEDGRWLAEVLALRVLAERLERDESGPQSISIAVPTASDRGLRPRPDVVFAFHDAEKTGPRMLVQIAKCTGLKPEGL
jgi:hypothetical protein